MNKHGFLKALTQVYCRLGITSHGVGVIAIRPIPKGTDPFKNCDTHGDVLQIPEAELEAYDASEAAKALVRDFCALQDGTYFVPNYGIDAIDKSYFVNHSRTPNLHVRKDGEQLVAARDIKAGEELTSDYRLYHDARGIEEL